MNHNNNISVNVNVNVKHEVKYTQDEDRSHGISELSGLRQDDNAPSANNKNVPDSSTHPTFNSSTHPTFNHKMGDTVNPDVDNNTNNFTGIQIKKNSSSNYAWLITISLVSRFSLTTDNNFEFFGNRVDGQKEGFGKQIWKDGANYQGFFKNNQANGYGSFKHSDGDDYCGNYNYKGIYLY